jgi:hypothetical protein
VPNLTAMGSNLFDLIKSGSFVTYADDELRLAIQRTVAKETPRGIQLTKEKSSHKIDVVIALAMAALHAVEQSSRNIELMQIVGTQPAKIFSLETGKQLNADPVSLPGPQGPNAEAQIASLKAQEAELRPPRVTNYELTPEAQARLEAFKQRRRRENFTTLERLNLMPLRDAEREKREEKFMQVDKQRREARRKSSRREMLNSYVAEKYFHKTGITPDTKERK